MIDSEQIVIREMTPKDIEEVMEIESVAFAAPLSRDGLFREMRLPMARLRVALVKDRVVGYLNYWIVQDEIHILNIAVSVSERRQGIGSALFDFMLRETKEATGYHLELRVSNEGAKQFYERYGFKVYGKRPKYYANNQEDALLMGLER